MYSFNYWFINLQNFLSFTRLFVTKINVYWVIYLVTSICTFALRNSYSFTYLFIYFICLLISILIILFI
jgi:hypothetical protein